MGMKPRKIVKRKTKVQQRRLPVAKYVVVSNKGYGNALKGTKIYYEGKKPKGLGKDGSISFGKHVLEALKRKFGNEKFHWIITAEEDSIKSERSIIRVRTSQQTLTRMGRSLWDRTRDIKNDTVANFFSIVYPSHFTHDETPVYVAGTLSHMLNGKIIPRMSTEDREAMNAFLPDFIAAESLNTVNLLKATAQIKTLKELAADLEKSLDGSTYSEGHWQTYVKKNILIIQQGYISAIEKMNTVIGGTKFPDFALVTHDNYLDVLEIKKPNTQLLNYDTSRKNYFWNPEMAKAIIQTENYIENILHQADAVRNYIRDTYNIELKVLRPRGIILAGDTRKFASDKERDDFRLLCLSTKNIVFVTYDELLSRLQNYIKVLEEHSR